MTPQQMQMMQQMFQNPNGGGSFTPPPGQGGVGSGAGAALAPSFQGPDGAPGVQPLPFSGPMPDFTMAPFDPSQGIGAQPMGNGPIMPPGWSPAARDGQSIGRPMPARPGEGRAMPMPLERQAPPSPMGNGAYPRTMGGGIQGAGGMRGSDGMPRVPSRMGPNMDNMPRSVNPNGPNMDNMPGRNPADANGLPAMDPEKRDALIRAILMKQFGG